MSPARNRPFYVNINSHPFDIERPTHNAKFHSVKNCIIAPHASQARELQQQRHRRQWNTIWINLAAAESILNELAIKNISR